MPLIPHFLSSVRVLGPSNSLLSLEPVIDSQLSRENKIIQNNTPIRAMTVKVLEPFDEFGKLRETVMGDFPCLKWLVLVGFNLSSVEGW